ncbi:MAG: class I SAM-dependent methyltransferase, partial [Alphaproteobacteria bacterium]
MIERRPTLSLLTGRHKRLISGHPWIFSNEVVMDAAAKSLPPGSLVTVAAADGRRLGTASFNSHSLIAGRMLSSDPDVQIDARFFEARLRSALALRDSLYDRPFYRAVHSEADNLPGLIADRFGDVLGVQINTAGMERCLDMLMEAFDAVFAPRAIVLRNDSGVRVLEGLEKYVRVAKGEVSPPIEVEEGEAHFFIDPLAGQKTGWFFDQRDNRAFMASLARSKRVGDFYSYAGGFAIRAALAGAREVRAFDSSEPALELARRAAERNGVSSICKFERAEAFAELEKLAKAGERFDVVI